MSGNRKLGLIGLGWSILVMAVFFAVEPSARTPSFLFAMLVLVAGWVVAANLSKAFPEKGTDDQVSGQDTRELIGRSAEAMSRVSSEISRQVGAMRDEVARVQNIFNEAIEKLVASFHGMNAQVHRQQKLAIEVVAGGAEGGINEMSRRTGATLDELDAIGHEVEQAVNQAIMSLQFQDMVTQLLGHVGRRLDTLDEIAGDENQLANILQNSTTSAETLAALSAICSHVDHISQKMDTVSQKVDNNPVSQTGFASGGVELF